MTVTAPTSPDELAAFLNDSKQIEEAFKDVESTKQFMNDYAANVNKRNPEMTDELREQMQAEMAKMLRDNGYGGSPVDMAAKKATDRAATDKVLTGKGAAYNKAAPGAKLDADAELGHIGEFLQAAYHRYDKLANRSELAAKRAKIEEIQNAYSSTVPGDGGFLIPETMRSQLLSVALETAVVRPRAQVLPMDSLRLPIPTIDSTSNASSVYGGIVGYWTEEGAALTATSASFGRVVLEAKKLTGYTEIPNELMADAIAAGAFFSQTFPKALSFFEDKAFLSGSGVGEPLGVYNGTAAVSVSRSGGAGTTIVFADAVSMYTRMLPTSLDSAVWLVAPDSLGDLLEMTLASNSPAVFLSAGLGPAPVMTLLGRPIIVTEKAPAHNAAATLSLIDFGYYLIGDRQAMQAESSTEYKFANDMTAFRIIERVDGRPWIQTAITPANGSSNTLSPIVTIGA